MSKITNARIADGAIKTDEFGLSYVPFTKTEGTVTQSIQVWLTYVDQTDGCDRESWSVFYTTPIVTTSQAAAEQAGRDEIAALCEGDPETDPDEYTAHIIGPLEVKQNGA